jgi:hypothetical protein
MMCSTSEQPTANAHHFSLVDLATRIKWQGTSITKMATIEDKFIGPQQAAADHELGRPSR